MRILMLFSLVLLSGCQSAFDRSENITGFEIYSFDKNAERIFTPLKRCTKFNSLGKVYSEKSGYKKERHFCEAKFKSSGSRPKNWAYLYKVKGSKLKFCKYAITDLEFMGTTEGEEFEMIVSKPKDCYEIQNP